MAMKDFDAKQFLLQRGERLGLGIALFLMIVLILWNLFVPPRGFFSGKPATKVAELKQPTQAVISGLANNRPTRPEDIPPADGGTTNTAFRFDPLDPSKFEMLPLFPHADPESSQRRPPDLLTLDEAATAVARIQIGTYIASFDKDGQPVALKVLTDAPENKNQGGTGLSFNPTMMMGTSGPGGKAGIPGISMSGMGAIGGRNNPTRHLRQPGKYPGIGGDDAPKEYKFKFVRLTDLKDKSAHFAEQVRPVRMAIIAASFPYKAQLEQFREKLHLTSLGDVLKEMSLEKDRDGQPLPAFRFKGVTVQRRTLDVNDKVLKDWETIDLNATYKPFLFLTGKRFQPDDPKYLPISFKGLVMPRLAQLHMGVTKDNMNPLTPMSPTTKPGKSDKDSSSKDGPEEQYPAVEDRVENLRTTLESFKDKTPVQAVAPSQFKVDDNLDVFDSQSNPTATSGTGTDGKTVPMTEVAQDADIPSHCLVRLIDLTIEPGKIYQYRLQVRMANPNYKRKEVASPSYAVKQELESDKWFVVPQKVAVPPELIYYALDQAILEKDPNKYMRQHPVPYINHDREAVFQAHRWLETVPYQKEDLLVGEWAVAERYIVRRGEYVGRKLRVKFPLWRDTMEDFVIATDPTAVRFKRKDFLVSFGYDREDLDTILVDFEGSNRMSYDMMIGKNDEGKPLTKAVADTMAEEVLMLGADGKLLARNGARDMLDSERVDRLEKVRDRIKAIEDKAKPKSEDTTKPDFNK